MKTKRALWGVLTVVGVMMLLYLAYGLTHLPKAKTPMRRAQGENIMRTASITLTNTGTAPTMPPSPGQ
jgi:threonine/homoserine/homoserine lactone efflux protein